MKHLKKLIAVLLLFALALTVTGCSSAPDACESCGETDAKLKKYTVDGESAWLCPNCGALIDLIDALGDLY